MDDTKNKFCLAVLKDNRWLLEQKEQGGKNKISECGQGEKKKKRTKNKKKSQIFFL